MRAVKPQLRSGCDSFSYLNGNTHRAKLERICTTR